MVFQFSHFFLISSQLLESGKAPISLLHHLYEICILIRTNLYGKDDTYKFIEQLNGKCKGFLSNQNSLSSDGFLKSDEKNLSYLLLYCETNTDLPKPPDRIVVDLLFDFSKKVLQDKVQISLEMDIPRKINCCLVVLTRFAIRDNELASEVTPLLAHFLRKTTMHISILNTCIQCVTDLCKRHTSVVQPIFKVVVDKLEASNNQEVRLCALSNLFDLLNQDFIKMKGRILLNILACLVDKNELLKLKTRAALLSFINDVGGKGKNLLYTCFIESVYVFNDFMNADSLGVFPYEEIDRNRLPLCGMEHQEQRLELYSFFVDNILEINEIQLVMLLNQIIVLKEKLEKKMLKHSKNGLTTFKDLLVIFKIVIEKQGGCKANTNGSSNEKEYADVLEPESTSQAPETKTGRRKNAALSMDDAKSVIEKVIAVYPQFTQLVFDYDKSLKNDVNELSKSIAHYYSSFIEFSNHTFWKKHQTRSKKDKKNKNKMEIDVESDSE